MPKITKTQIEAWKKKHGDIFKYTTEDDKVCYLKRPDRKTYSYAQMTSGNDHVKFNEILLENCWLEGDKDIKTKDAYFMGISAKLEDLIEITLGELEKL